MTNRTAPQFEAHIGGRWQGPASGDWLDVRDPADWGQVVGRVPALTGQTVLAGFTTAREGARIWAATNALRRGEILHEAARLIRERSQELIALLSRENGKTLGEATVEVAKSAEFFEFYAAMSRLPYGELLHDSRPDTTITVRQEAIGVVLVITPWNDPLLTPARKLAPALAMGNSIVLKPASDTPLIALALTRVLLDAGLPPQAMTTVTGRARDLGDALLASDEIDAVTFTGSTTVGLSLQRALAGRNVRLQNEMGGKNAAIVLADADLDVAADVIASAGFAQGGQRCTATSRVLVAEQVKERLLERLVARAQAIRVGRGDAPDTDLGPLVNPAHQSEVIDFVTRAAEAGATVLTGGGDTDQARGCFVEPTVIAEVDTSMEIWTDEVFGPVIAVHAIPDLETGIRLANESAYGLSAALFTRDLRASSIFLRDIETGQAAVNLPTSGWDVHHPFGGFKLSGSAFKEQGLEALGFYTRTKTCAVRAL